MHEGKTSHALLSKGKRLKKAEIARGETNKTQRKTTAKIVKRGCAIRAGLGRNGSDRSNLKSKLIGISSKIDETGGRVKRRI